MNLNDLLVGNNIDPHDVVIMRHRPHEQELRRILPWLAAEKPNVFNAYQSTHSEKVEKALKRAKYIASFIGHEAGKALFIGLYEIKGSKPITYKKYWEIPAHKEMKTFGMVGFTSERSSCLWFNLKLLDFYAHWKGKMIVQWPGLERSWWRWADRNIVDVCAILEESILDASMPDWDQIKLTWDELSVIPSSWKVTLEQWRGIYYIFDISDGKGYVGSAYGSSNLLGRWKNYASSGHGNNKLLRNRNSKNFIFTILQRVSPDMSADEVIRLESRWKDRLHTRSPVGLNEN
jgi:hypothetical protein